MASVITALEPSWIAPFAGLSPRRFGKLVTAARRESVGAAQRFLSAFSGISPHFRPRRHLMTGTRYRAEMTVRFTVWEQVTGVTGRPGLIQSPGDHVDVQAGRCDKGRVAVSDTTKLRLSG